jgi:hypothetical protein
MGGGIGRLLVVLFLYIEVKVKRHFIDREFPQNYDGTELFPEGGVLMQPVHLQWFSFLFSTRRNLVRGGVGSSWWHTVFL